MKLSVIVPVLNEAKTIRRIVGRVLEVPLDLEIIVVDDGSTDGTIEALGDYISDPRLKTARHEKNRGKGSAIRTGLGKVTGDVVVIQDGDLEYDPNDFIAMMERIEGGADVVYGSRIRGGGPFSYRSFYWGGRLLSILANLLYGLSITDEPTCYKMMRTDIMRAMELESTGFEFCPEATAKAARLGHEIVEIPISYSPRSISEGKKIRWSDGMTAIWTLLKYRFWRPSIERTS